MHYVIQEDIYINKQPEFYYMLDDLGLTYTNVRCLPFTDKIVKSEDYSDNCEVDDLIEYTPLDPKIFIFGSVKFSRIARNVWGAGTYHNDNHDYNVYSSIWKDNLLNYDGKVFPFIHDGSLWGVDHLMFLRPTLDNKLFSGKRFSPNEWNDSLKASLESGLLDNYNLKEQFVQVAPLKKIYEEVRFFCIKGKVITGSRYMFNGKLSVFKYYPNEAEEFAQKMIDIWTPADAFVLDVCLTDNGWKIVEVNCFNSSGFYDIDQRKLLTSIEELL